MEAEVPENDTNVSFNVSIEINAIASIDYTSQSIFVLRSSTLSTLSPTYSQVSHGGGFARTLVDLPR